MSDQKGVPAQCDAGHGLSYQKRVQNWLMECFSMEVCRDGTERNHRFLEEALELVQSLGCTQSEAHQLVDYVFGRPVGEPVQELGGTLVTLAALASCHDMDLDTAGETELARVWTKIEKIRAKQAAKPKHSPLPGPSDARTLAASDIPERFKHEVAAIANELGMDHQDLTTGKIAEFARNLRARVEDAKWRTLEDCPDDGSKVWVIGGRHEEPTIVKADGGWWRWSASKGHAGVPTHWMPLRIPSRPSTARKD